MDIQSFNGKAHLKIDAKNTLDVKGNLAAAKPDAAAQAKLPVTPRLPAVYRSNCIVLLPQVLEPLVFFCQSTEDFSRVKIPVEARIDSVPSLPVHAASDEFVDDLLRQGIRQFLVLLKAFRNSLTVVFLSTGGPGDFPAARFIGEMEKEHSLVVHMRNSSK